MSHPHRCPLCQGSGELPTNTTNPYVVCHACNGKGIVWEPESASDRRARRELMQFLAADPDKPVPASTGPS